MSYCSEVKILAGKNVAKKINEAIKKFGCPFDTIKEDNNGVTLFAADSVKWYEDDDSFPEVKAVMDIVEEYANKSGCGREDGIEYARMGEENEDYEWRGNGSLPAYLCRTIEVVGFAEK